MLILDTPGHNDFIRLRQRGVSLTSAVVLVIDAREGVMNQTKEIIKHIQEHSLPTLVFINHKQEKVEKNDDISNKIFTQLQEEGLTVME